MPPSLKGAADESLARLSAVRCPGALRNRSCARRRCSAAARPRCDLRPPVWSRPDDGRLPAGQTQRSRGHHGRQRRLRLDSGAHRAAIRRGAAQARLHCVRRRPWQSAEVRRSGDPSGRDPGRALHPSPGEGVCHRPRAHRHRRRLVGRPDGPPDRHGGRRTAIPTPPIPSSACRAGCGRSPPFFHRPTI